MPPAKPIDPTNTCRVLIVDDHPIVREGLAMLINQEPDMEVCAEATTIAQALKKIHTSQPDVALIDIGLGDENGLNLVKRIISDKLAVRTLVWSAHPDSIYAERALAAGALGYINKALITGQLLIAIRQVWNGEIYLSADETQRLLRRKLNLGSRGDKRPNRDVVATLSNRELEVLRLIGKGRSTSEIGAALTVSVNTVETHRQRIKNKLDIKSARELTTWAIRWEMENSGEQELP